MAARYPDPAVEIATPAFVTGKSDFTSQAELEFLVDDLTRRSRYRPIAYSIALLIA